MDNISRRTFLKSGSVTALASISIVAAPTVTGIELLDLHEYPIPKAPIKNSVEFQTMIKAERGVKLWEVEWEFALDPYFENVINKDHVLFTSNEEQTIKVELIHVPADIQVYYRLNCKNCSALEVFQDEFETSHHYVMLPQTKMQETAGVIGVKQAPSLQREY